MPPGAWVSVSSMFPSRLGQGSKGRRPLACRGSGMARGIPEKAGAGTPMAYPRSLYAPHPSPATYAVRPLPQSMLSTSPNPMRTAAHPPPVLHQGVGLIACFRDESPEFWRPLRSGAYLERPALAARLELDDDSQPDGSARGLAESARGVKLVHLHGATSP